VIKKGWGWKRGQMSFRAWKPARALSNQELVYHDAEMGREPPVHGPRNRSRCGDKCARTSPRGSFEEIIEIETSPRTWYFSPRLRTGGKACGRHGPVGRPSPTASDNPLDKHHSYIGPAHLSTRARQLLRPASLPSRTRADDRDRHACHRWSADGNVPSSMLPSPSKVEFMLHGVVGVDKSRPRACSTSQF
jgi:hypothetical protein